MVASLIPVGASSATLYIDGNRCQACRRCIARTVCPVKAIVHLRDEQPYIDVHRCFHCRLCLPECPFDAIVLA